MKQLLLSCLLLLAATFSICAQDLPDAWSVSDDGRLLTAGGENNGGFYEPDEVHTISLEFTEDNWWDILTQNYDSGTDLLATCIIDGERYDSVGVRFKGETSYRRNPSEKKSFNITLDAVIDGQDVNGYNTFNLNCGWEDNSSMREVLYNNIGHNYYMSLKAGYANLEINGQNWGPYQNVQQFDSDYIREWYLSNDGTIWRATSSRRTRPGPGGGGRFGQGTSTLNYNGPDSTDYLQDYVLRRTEQDDPWAGMIAAVDVLNNEPLATLEAALAPVLDIDKACWFLAHENVWADDDGYINKGGSDYFVYYEAETGRLVPMEYDGNSVLGDRAILWGPLYREGEDDFPLIDRMLAVPAIRQRYLAHMRVILEDHFTEKNANSKIDAYTALLRDLVEADPKKFYSDAEWDEGIEDLKSDVTERRNILLNSPELMAGTEVTVGDVRHSVNGVEFANPSAEEPVNVTTTVSAAAGIASVTLYYGTGLTGVFDQTELFDDGQHGDGAAGDGQYGGEIPAIAGTSYVRYYVAATAADDAGTVAYAPKGAEHDVYLYQIGGTSSLAGDLVINEFMAANDATQADQDGEFDDWIELYNNTASPIALDGFYLSDDAAETDKWAFPAGTTIGANGYLMIWADGDDEQEGLHASFKLSADGEQVVLADANLAIIDSVSFSEQVADVSYGRFPNGTGPFQTMAPTFDAENTDAMVSTDSPLALELGLRVFPNPNDGNFLVNLKEAASEDLQLILYSVDGRLQYARTLRRGATQLRVEQQDLVAGVYTLVVRSGAGVVGVRVVVR
ncbi:CotH kinase family protein [Lewinella sp. 4G2]|uniref:CotH kinase family protein n=1 Tax=Lewinella sp. 4G2 TaxID=1803372 RepID=UPI0007B491CF|nr:CotH kinase family protein [Lewinella sp. 4G2]OAV45697.1 hypothetical protein A3850_014885 [Lewinella sp. 4G2]